MHSDDSKPSKYIEAKDKQSRKDRNGESPNAAGRNEQRAARKDPAEEPTTIDVIQKDPLMRLPLIRRGAYVCAALSLWITICVFIVDSFSKGILFYIGGPLIGGFLLGIIATVIVFVHHLGLWWLPALLYAMPIVMWFFVGNYNLMRDLIILVIILVLVRAKGSKLLDLFADINFLPLWARSRKLLQVVQAGLCLIMVWVISSAADHYMGPFWTPQPQILKNFDKFSQEPKDSRIALALSGGGFRAAILHAGVLDALEKSGIKVTALSTVSGGSIIGGFYALGGEPKRFRDAVIKGRFNLRRDLFNIQNMIRLPMPGRIKFSLFEHRWEIPLLPIKSSFTRTDVLAKQLERVLYGNISIFDANLRNGMVWIIGTTDLLSGDAVGISAKGVYRRALPVLDLTKSEGYMHREHSLPKFEKTTKIHPEAVSHIVASSCSFPGALAAVPGKYESDSNKAPVELLLADGGITDNSGLALLLAAWVLPPPNPIHKFDFIIASNGGKSLQRKRLHEHFLKPFRALDVIYAASGVYVPKSEASKNKGPQFVPLTPESMLAKSSEAIRTLIGWADSKKDELPPIGSDELRGFLDQELPDDMLKGLKKEVGAIGSPKHLVKSWRRVVEKSNESAYDDERFKAKLNVVLDFIHVSDVFERASTLNDIFPKEDVEALFRLGRYFVYLNQSMLNIKTIATSNVHNLD